MWPTLAKWWHEIWIALLLALFFAIFADLMRIGSRIREAIRLFWNKLSEFSVIRLKKRILELEERRDELTTFLSSDKRVYLAALRIVLTALVMIAMGATTLAIHAFIGNFYFFGHAEMRGASWIHEFHAASYYLASAFFSVGTIIAIRGMKMSSWDTSEKVKTAVKQFNDEIETLRQKLALRERQ